ncbi:hypothetical protein DBR32_07880 [Taibaiella sp. KBW10]|uniref:hypothetical protein n=1 Tax=Taibaiella sp. KBW10 TaxID=2153357 RepID=UPI000F596929|nr:hypothetical protein [Taibaiella sp. KBW10]RQO30644.1 hypothetical protein DBR32_07880 [Taibaiella sp. KBW10]
MMLNYASLYRGFFLLLGSITVLTGNQKTIAQIPLVLQDTTLQQGASFNYCMDAGWQHMDSALILDDFFSDTVDIGFAFSFFGNSYTQCALSGNVFLSFNLSNTDNVSPFAWSNTNTIFHNAIFPAFLDANMNTSGSVKYQTQGASGSRIFIAEWCGVPKYGIPCAGEKVTTQIVLHEGTNRIELNTLSFPGSVTCPTTNANGKGIQGLINSNNTASVLHQGVVLPICGVIPGR